MIQRRGRKMEITISNNYFGADFHYKDSNGGKMYSTVKPKDYFLRHGFVSDVIF